MHTANGYQQQPNNYWKIAVLIALAFFAFFMLQSCNVELKTQREDQKALSRVEAKAELSNAAAAAWLKDHPIRCDSLPPVYIPGKPYPMPIFITVKDSNAIKAAIDSVKNIFQKPDCDYAIDAAYKQGYNDALKAHPSMMQVDTSKTTKVDRSSLDRANDSLAEKELKIAGLKAQLLQKEKDDNDKYESLKREKKIWMFIVIAIAVILIVSGTAWFIKKFKSFTPVGVVSSASTSLLSSIEKKL